MLQHCVALKIVVANRLVKHHLNVVDSFCLDLNHTVNSRGEKRLTYAVSGVVSNITRLLLINCHDVTFGIFDR